MARTDRLTASEIRFERYLATHGYSFEKLDEANTGRPSPDYLIARGTSSAICEVKQFEDSPLERWSRGGGGFLAQSAKRHLDPIRNKIGKASRQLRAHLDSGLPLVVVLSNPHHVAVGLRPDDIAMAMCGDPTLTMAIDSEGEAGSAVMAYGFNGKLTNHHSHISAVVTLDPSGDWEENWLRDRGDEARLFSEQMVILDQARRSGDAPPGEHLAASVVETPSAVEGTAVRLPSDLFDGPLDRVWSWDDDGVQVRLR